VFDGEEKSQPVKKRRRLWGVTHLGKPQRSAGRNKMIVASFAMLDG
jgi:hypothetical protein